MWKLNSGINVACIAVFTMPTCTVSSALIPLGMPGVISMSMVKLLMILRNQVLHHQFDKAVFTMETITMAMDNVPEVVRKVCCLLHCC